MFIADFLGARFRVAAKGQNPLLDLAQAVANESRAPTRRSMARCSRAVEAGCLSIASIAISKYSVASRNAERANAFFAAMCP